MRRLCVMRPRRHTSLLPRFFLGISTYMDAPQFARIFSLFGIEVSVAVLHSAFNAERALLAPMKFAAEGLISCKNSEFQSIFRLTSTRSDLFCHHIDNIPTQPLKNSDSRDFYASANSSVAPL